MAGFFDTLFAPFNPNIGADAARSAADVQSAGIEKGYQDLSNLYGQGRGALTTNFTQALQPFLQNLGYANRGMGAIADAMGLNGPQGTQNAYRSFMGTVQPAIQMGSENVLRNAAAGGGGGGGAGGASGGTLAALQDYAQKTAMGGWQNYVSNLSPFYNYSLANTQGLGNIYTGLGTGLNQSYMGQGGAAAGADSAEAAARANAINAAAQARYGAGKDIWDTAIGGATALSKFFPSDIRVKDDVERIGSLNDGLPVYRFRYKGRPETHVGVMAQDVERRDPGAVVKIGGVRHVDYHRATNYAADLGRFLEAA
jgi:hypothetical protein